MLRRWGESGRGRFARSLTGRLLVLWSLSLAAALLAVLLLVGFARQSLSARSERAAALAQTGCGLVREQFVFYAAGLKADAGAPSRGDLAAVVALGLRDLPAMTGGIWQDATPLVAVRNDRRARSVFPAPGVLAPLVAQAMRDERAAQGAREGISVSACLLPGPWPDLVAWVASPAATPAPAGFGHARGGPPFGLGLGLGLLLLLIAGIALWSSRLLLAWRRALGQLETAVRQAGGVATPPGSLKPAGEPGLDRVIEALNESGRQLAEAQARAASAARLAALGRVAAGVAHEVRNPIAAIRLRAENAIAGNDSRRAAALPAIMVQIARLERLTGSLLDMTRQRVAQPVVCELRALCAEIAQSRMIEAGRAETVELLLLVAPGPARLDSELLQAGLGNLVLNAAQHARGKVTVTGEVADGRVRLVVGDDGPGVAPILRETLFDPFVTGRPEGTGLGLAIAREAIAAHGGTITLDETMPAGDRTGSRFIIEIPQ